MPTAVTRIHPAVLPVYNHGLTFGFNAKCACSFVKRWWIFLSGLELTGDAGTVHGALLNLREGRSDLFRDDPANFHIAFIRDPLERIRSAFADKVGNPYNQNFYKGEGLTFERWIASLLEDAGNRRRWDDHWRPQSLGLRPHRWDRFVDIDTDLEAAVRAIERDFGLPELTFDHIRDRRISKPAVSEEVFSLVWQIYQEDFEFFDQHCPELSESWIRGPVPEEDYVFVEAASAVSTDADTAATDTTAALPVATPRKPPWDATLAAPPPGLPPQGRRADRPPRSPEDE